MDIHFINHVLLDKVCKISDIHDRQYLKTRDWSSLSTKLIICLCQDTTR